MSDKRTPYQRKAGPALLKAVEHWERLRDGEPEPGEKDNVESCACCQTFGDIQLDDYGNQMIRDCGDCPITLRTGHPFCANTPFSEASEEFAQNGADSDDGPIQEEIDFLLGTRRLVLQGVIKPEDS